MKKIETEGEADETLPANAMNDEEFDIYANRLLSIALGPN